MEDCLTRAAPQKTKTISENMTTSETPQVKPDTKRTVPPHLIVPSKRAHEMLVQALDDLLTEAEATQPHETCYMRAAKKALSVARGEFSDDQTQPLPLCEEVQP